MTHEGVRWKTRIARYAAVLFSRKSEEQRDYSSMETWENACAAVAECTFFPSETPEYNEYARKIFLELFRIKRSPLRADFSGARLVIAARAVTSAIVQEKRSAGTYCGTQEITHIRDMCEVVILDLFLNGWLVRGGAHMPFPLPLRHGECFFANCLVPYIVKKEGRKTDAH